MAFSRAPSLVVVLLLAMPVAILPATGGRAMALTVKPIIQNAPGEIGYGGTFVIGTPDAPDIAAVELVPASAGGLLPGGPKVPLAIEGRSAQALTVREPASPGVAPPGPYLLFIEEQTLLGLIPSAARAVTVAQPAQPAASPTSASSGSEPGEAPADGANAAANPSSPSPSKANSAGSDGTRKTVTTPARARTGSVKGRNSGDQAPMAKFPWLLVLIPMFVFVVWRLARMTEPAGTGDRKR